MGHFSRMHASRCRSAAAGSEVRGSAPAAAAPSQEEIARLAYSYWEARGMQGGSAVDDWLRAERELRERSSGLEGR